MSIRAIQAVWDRSTVGGSLRLLLLALADFADEDGYSWPSVETLSKRTARSERHVRRLITLAIGAGELKADRVGGTTSSRYWLTPGGVHVGRGDIGVLPPGRGRPPPPDIRVPPGGTPVSPEPSSNGHRTPKEPSGDIRPPKKMTEAERDRWLNENLRLMNDPKIPGHIRRAAEHTVALLREGRKSA